MNSNVGRPNPAEQGISRVCEALISGSDVGGLGGVSVRARNTRQLVQSDEFRGAFRGVWMLPNSQLVMSNYSTA